MQSPETDLVPLRITHIDEIASGVWQFDLRDDSGRDLPPFSPGSHISVQVPNGAIRKYSLCNDPAERHRYVIAVKRDAGGRGGSVSLTDEAGVGDLLPTSLPENFFPLKEGAPSYIFVAGGIGITPILAMIRSLESAGHTRWKLFYCSRAPETTAFLDELGAPEFAGRVKVHHDYGDPAKSLDLWPLFEKAGTAHVYCCGPRPLMDGVRDMTGHWNPANIHFESFVDGSALARPEDQPFTIRLARSGEELEVAPGTTMLEALRRAGHSVPASCESGTCGSCRTRLLEGEADHRDMVLTEDERQQYVMVCVSRARCERLVLDL
ncbi:PDR/VanB family oxidoreductase [Hyphomicrobium sp.]|uniref:PDR/VanB family oxidoreductase n=1 Tax=Hyphomicrobium sp. TaxID=82 RepID=UPI002FE176A9